MVVSVGGIRNTYVRMTIMKPDNSIMPHFRSQRHHIRTYDIQSVRRIKFIGKPKKPFGTIIKITLR